MDLGNLILAQMMQADPSGLAQRQMQPRQARPTTPVIPFPQGAEAMPSWEIPPGVKTFDDLSALRSTELVNLLLRGQMPPVRVTR